MNGPYTLADLRSAIDSASFPIDSHVLLDTGQSSAQLEASRDWKPVTELLGMPPPASSTTRSDPETVPDASPNRTKVRDASEYRVVRGLVTLGAAVSIVVTVVQSLVVLAQIGRSNTPGTVAVTLGGQFMNVLIIVVVAGALQALFDIADCALRRTN